MESAQFTGRVYTAEQMAGYCAGVAAHEPPLRDLLQQAITVAQYDAVARAFDEIQFRCAVEDDRVQIFVTGDETPDGTDVFNAWFPLGDLLKDICYCSQRELCHTERAEISKALDEIEQVISELRRKLL